MPANRLNHLILPALVGATGISLLQIDCGPFLFRILAVMALSGWLLFLGQFVLGLVRAYGVSVTRYFSRDIFPAAAKG